MSDGGRYRDMKPPGLQKDVKQSRMGDQQAVGEVFRKEDILSDETPINCPFEQKLSGKFERSQAVASGMLRQERVSEQYLNL